MPVIEIPSTVSTVSVENFPAKVKEDKAGKSTERPFQRSCEGALYLRPGVKVVTSDELAHLKEKQPKLYRQIRVVALTKEEREEVKGAQAKPAPVPQKVVEEVKKTEKKAEPVVDTKPEVKK